MTFDSGLELSDQDELVVRKFWFYNWNGLYLEAMENVSWKYFICNKMFHSRSIKKAVCKFFLKSSNSPNHSVFVILLSHCISIIWKLFSDSKAIPAGIYLRSFFKWQKQKIPQKLQINFSKNYVTFPKMLKVFIWDAIF